MSRAGEIQRLSQIAEPNIGVVTNVRPVHLENFRSMQGIALAKRELIESLPADGVAVLNNDDGAFASSGGCFPGKVLTFGVEAAAAYRASEIRSLGLEGQEFRLDHKAQGHRLQVATDWRAQCSQCPSGHRCSPPFGRWIRNDRPKLEGSESQRQDVANCSGFTMGLQC
jgi:UDP-N-acetylmuramyl pentapeptide synthase